jgi:hypothetical protein
MSMRIHGLAVALLAFFALHGTALAQPYPSKPDEIEVYGRLLKAAGIKPQ